MLHAEPVYRFTFLVILEDGILTFNISVFFFFVLLAVKELNGKDKEPTPPPAPTRRPRPRTRPVRTTTTTLAPVSGRTCDQVKCDPKTSSGCHYYTSKRFARCKCKDGFVNFGRFVCRREELFIIKFSELKSLV